MMLPGIVMSEAKNQYRLFNIRKILVPGILLAGMVLVAFWEIMANRSRSPFKPFEITAEDFRDFKPFTEGWSFEPVPVTGTPSEPNILAFRVMSRANDDSAARRFQVSGFRFQNCPVLVRLVHGYNMPDCMRIKGYRVEIIEDRSQQSAVSSQNMGIGERSAGIIGNGESKMEPRIPTLLEVGTDGRGTQNLELRTQDTASGNQVSPGIQIWRLTLSSGDVSIWVTSMIRVGDFSLADIDVRSMPFPRVGIPDDPGWFPQGITLSSLRHPVEEFRLFLRSRWNASRCDLATFLRLKTPAWASDEYLTLVSASEGVLVKPGGEAEVTAGVAAVHNHMYSKLLEWKKGIVR